MTCAIFRIYFACRMPPLRLSAATLFDCIARSMPPLQATSAASVAVSAACAPKAFQFHAPRPTWMALSAVNVPPEK